MPPARQRVFKWPETPSLWLPTPAWNQAQSARRSAALPAPRASARRNSERRPRSRRRRRRTGRDVRLFGPQSAARLTTTIDSTLADLRPAVYVTLSGAVAVGALVMVLF